jgi:imidazolonepropionase-like amidohydrolase
MHPRTLWWALAAVALTACGGARQEPARPAPAAPPSASARAERPEPFPSTYRALPSRPTLIRNATVLTGTGPRLEGASVLLRDGRIAAVGRDIAAPPDAEVIDAAGRWITPGLIDTHSHLGVYSAPGGDALSDGNEMTDPNTAEVWAEHSVWPQDPQFPLALAAGVTAMQILPGSANLFGGRGVTLKNVPARTVQAMKFPGAPHGLKMACGENPKRVYGSRGRFPSTRMGNVAGYRMAWIQAQEYRDRWHRWQAEGADPASQPNRNLRLETLAGVLDGDILVHNHCYRADEMAIMIDVAREFGYRITSFHHGVEAYKIRDLLAQEGICSSLWADWWGFKVEAMDGILQNIPLVHEAGACAIVHSDSPEGIQRLNQEAAKTLRAAHEVGMRLDYEDAIQWITINAAKALGVDRWTGSVEAGKMADVVVWSGDPFSVYSKADLVFIDGALVFDRADPTRQPRTDFELGHPTREVGW